MSREIKFRDGSFCLGCTPLSSFRIRDYRLIEKINTGRGHMNDHEEKWWDFEVIGNIYENPNLLNNE
jgi:hypothetical protein